MWYAKKMDPCHKSNTALDKYPTINHFVRERCTHVQLSVTKWCIVGYGTGALWDLCKMYINRYQVIIIPCCLDYHSWPKRHIPCHFIAILLLCKVWLERLQPGGLFYPVVFSTRPPCVLSSCLHGQAHKNIYSLLAGSQSHFSLENAKDVAKNLSFAQNLFPGVTFVWFKRSYSLRSLFPLFTQI